MEHFELVLFLVQKAFLYIPKDVVSLQFCSKLYFKKHVFEVTSKNNAQNANVE